MESISLGFENMTTAIKVRRLLRDLGVRSRLIKTDGVLNIGCRYALEIDRGDYLRSIAEINRRKIKYQVIE